ncbi:MAG: ABC transporter ATP-binding protein [Planctomycetes bacterium]|nr:ABC transporter ATP-binding protein [Planctomycetota bacterium]
MSDVAFRFDNVVKRFGKTEVLRGFSLSVPRGSVVGFVGRNGAGKTTAIRCLMGLQKPTEGRVELLGCDPWDLDVPTKRRIGYLSETGVPFPWATADDLTGLCAPLYPDWDAGLERNLLERFQIDRRKKLRALSLGQQRAVGLMLALCPRPEVLVLDEPAANLDAVVRRGFLEQVLALVAKEGRTVFFSSHILSDVERVADRLAVIHEGRLLMDRPTDTLKESVRRLRLVFLGEPPEDLAIPGAVRLRRAGREVLVTVDGYAPGMEDALARSTGAQVQAQAVGLEEMFIDLVGDGGRVS